MPLDKPFFEDMPKAEVHMHMDGAISQEDIWDISQRHKVTLPELPEQSQSALEAYYRLPPDASFKRPEDFNRFLAMFRVALSIMQTKEGLRETATAHVRDLASQNYVYAETRFAPQYHRTQGLSLEEVIQAALEGLQRGYVATGTLVKLIVCIGRECDQETSEAVARAALAFQDNGVVALDLACNEADFPPELHVPAYQLTFGSKLRRTVHAGEFPDDLSIRRQNISTALGKLKTDGLGHALALNTDEALMELVRDEKVRVEACPLSNMVTGAVSGISATGVDTLLRNDVRVSLNTDDPLMFGAPLSQVFHKTCEAFDFERDDVRRLLRNAVEGAFCSEEERDQIFREFTRRDFPLTVYGRDLSP